MQYGYICTAAFVTAINEHDGQSGIDRYKPMLFNSRSTFALESCAHIGNKEDNCPPKQNNKYSYFTICGF
jgi:hypothetical protein